MHSLEMFYLDKIRSQGFSDSFVSNFVCYKLKKVYEENLKVKLKFETQKKTFNHKTIKIN